MGLDPGERRTGVALSDPEGRLASPLLVITHSSLEKAVAAVAELAARHGVQGVVMGLAKNMDGTEGVQAARARRLARQLRERLGVDVVLVDERLSTFAAEEALAHLKPARRRRQLDAVAAAIILQEYLDAQAAGGSRGQEQ